jgi:hypothetical protein
MEAIIRGRNYMILIELTNTETFQMVGGRPFPMFASFTPISTETFTVNFWFG